jgi:hypothetical protein
MSFILALIRLVASSLMGFIPRKTSEPAPFWLASQVWNSAPATVSARAILWIVLPVARLRTRTATFSLGPKRSSCSLQDAEQGIIAATDGTQLRNQTRSLRNSISVGSRRHGRSVRRQRHTPWQRRSDQGSSGNFCKGFRKSPPVSNKKRAPSPRCHPRHRRIQRCAIPRLQGSPSRLLT